jgi:hypothetical protein
MEEYDGDDDDEVVEEEEEAPTCIVRTSSSGATMERETARAKPPAIAGEKSLIC